MPFTKTTFAPLFALLFAALVAFALLAPASTAFAQNTTPATTDTAAANTATTQQSDCFKDKYTFDTVSLIGKKEAPVTLGWAFILGFLGGLLALLTPCVFPMIPLTVSFFTKRSGSRAAGIRNALWYSASIIIIYVSLGLAVTAFFGGDALNALSTHWFFNLLFFALFTFFAFSFFGYYELTLPSSWAQSTDAQADKGGLVGIFFMAFTLSLVSFSCTGPIIGSMLPLLANGSVLTPAVTMFGFSLALALPFGLFAAFPSWLQTLPRSGSWMNSVKVVMGFLELALALKFLSNVDLVYHWGILRIEPFLVLWILIFGGMAAYLFGVFQFPHDSPEPRRTWVGNTGGALVAGFVVYLAFGLFTYTPLQWLVGLAPTTDYNFFHRTPIAGDAVADLHPLRDLDAAVVKARAEHKPIFIDFTGFACVNCRKLEQSVWLDPTAHRTMKQDYIVVSLYVDDAERLPEEQQCTNVFGRRVRTVGAKWAELETLFGQNTQPFYVLLTPDLRLLEKPVGYDAVNTPETFNAFMSRGLARWVKVK